MKETRNCNKMFRNMTDLSITIYHFGKKPKIILSIHKLSTCTFVWSIMTFYTWNLKPSSAAFLRSPALSLTLKKNSKYHDLKINRARALSLSLSLTNLIQKTKTLIFAWKWNTYVIHAVCNMVMWVGGGEVETTGTWLKFWIIARMCFFETAINSNRGCKRSS